MDYEWIIKLQLEIHMNEFHSSCDHAGNIIIHDNECAHDQ